MPRKNVVKGLVQRARRRLWIFLVLERMGMHNPPINLLSQLRPVLASHPTDENLIKATRLYLQGLNKKTIEEFRRYSKGREGPIVMITGCRKYYKKLTKSAKILRQQEEGLTVLGIIGTTFGTDWKIKFDKLNGILELPCQDGYEALPEKIIWGCLAVELCIKGASILKVDDDTKSIEADNIRQLKRKVIAEGNKAAGSPISIKMPLQIDRGWHLGKSSGPKNWQPYEGLGPKIWMSGGAGYLLTSEAVETAGNFALHSWNFVESQIYEDLLISWIVQSCCGKISWIEDFKTTGIRNERSEDIISGSRYHRKHDL